MFPEIFMRTKIIHHEQILFNTSIKYQLEIFERLIIFISGIKRVLL